MIYKKEFRKLSQGMNNEYIKNGRSLPFQRNEERILKSQDPVASIVFCGICKGANLELHSLNVLNNGNAEEQFYFCLNAQKCFDLPKEIIKAHQNIILEQKVTNIATLFAGNIKNCDKDLLSELVLKNGTLQDNLEFVLFVKDYDTKTHEELLLKAENVQVAMDMALVGNKQQEFEKIIVEKANPLQVLNYIKNFDIENFDLDAKKFENIFLKSESFWDNLFYISYTLKLMDKLVDKNSNKYKLLELNYPKHIEILTKSNEIQLIFYFACLLEKVIDINQIEKIYLNKKLDGYQVYQWLRRFGKKSQRVEDFLQILYANKDVKYILASANLLKKYNLKFSIENMAKCVLDYGEPEENLAFSAIIESPLFEQHKKKVVESKRGLITMFEKYALNPSVKKRKKNNKEKLK